MIKKSVFENEIISNMQKELLANDKSVAINKLDVAVDYLHSAIDIFESFGMQSQADATLNILLKIAKKHKKVDRHTKGLDSKKMLSNLMDHGTEFNLADDATLSDLLDADVSEEDLNFLKRFDLADDFEDEE